MAVDEVGAGLVVAGEAGAARVVAGDEVGAGLAIPGGEPAAQLAETGGEVAAEGAAAGGVVPGANVTGGRGTVVDVTPTVAGVIAHVAGGSTSVAVERNVVDDEGDGAATVRV